MYACGFYTHGGCWYERAFNLTYDNGLRLGPNFTSIVALRFILAALVTMALAFFFPFVPLAVLICFGFVCQPIVFLIASFVYSVYWFRSRDSDAGMLFLGWYQHLVQWRSFVRVRRRRICIACRDSYPYAANLPSFVWADDSAACHTCRLTGRYEYVDVGSFDPPLLFETNPVFESRVVMEQAAPSELCLNCRCYFPQGFVHDCEDYFYDFDDASDDVFSGPDPHVFYVCNLCDAIVPPECYLRGICLHCPAGIDDMRVIPLSVDEQDGDDSVFREMLVAAVPGLSEFIDAHPALAVVLSATWLTRSFYACRYIPGMIATVVELVSLAGLAIGTNTVASFATGVASFFKEMRDTGDFESDVAVVDEQGAGDLVSLFAVVAKGLTGDASLGRDDYQRIQIFRSSLGTMKDAVGFIKSSSLIVDFLKKCVRRWIFGPSDLDRLEDMILAWAEASPQFALVDMQEMTSERAQALIDLYETGLAIQAMVLKWPEALRLTHGPVFANTLRVAAAVYSNCQHYTRTHGTRPESFHAVIEGDADSLKSLVSNIVGNKVVADVIGRYDDKLVHTVNFNLDHFDGYLASTVVTIIDDYLQLKDDESRKAAAGFIYSAINHAKFTLPMAALLDKGMEFRSKLVLSTTNVDITAWFHDSVQSPSKPKKAERAVAGPPPPVVSMSGFRRRHHLIVETEILSKPMADALKMSGECDEPLLDQVVCYRVKYADRALNLSVGQKLTFTEFMTLVRQEVVRRGDLRGRFMSSIKAIAERENPSPVAKLALIDEMESRFQRAIHFLGASVTSFTSRASDSLETLYSKVKKESDDLTPDYEDGSASDVFASKWADKLKSKTKSSEPFQNLSVSESSPSKPDVVSVDEQGGTFRFVVEEEPPRSKRQRRRARALEQVRARRPGKKVRSGPPTRDNIVKRAPILVEEQFSISKVIGKAIAWSVFLTVRDVLRRAGLAVFKVAIFPYTALVAFFYGGIGHAVHAVKVKWRRIDEREKKYLLIMTVIVVILIIIGLVYYFRSSEVNDQYDAKERRVRKEPKKAEPIKVKPYAIREQGADANLETMKETLIMSSLGRITYLNSEKSNVASTALLCVGSDLAQVPRHLWMKAKQDGGMFHIHLPKKTGGEFFSVNEFRQVAEVPGTDVIFLRHPYFQVAAKDSYFVAQADIPKALRGELFLLTYRGGPGGLIPSELRAVSPRLSQAPMRGSQSGYDYTAGCLTTECPTLPGDCGCILMVRDPTLSGGRILGFHFAEFAIKGAASRACTTIITKEMMREVLSTPLSADEQFVEYTDIGLSQRLAHELYAQAPNVRFHGFSKQFVFSPDRNAIRRSPICDDLGPVTSIVSRCTRDLSGCQYGFKKMDRLKPLLNKESIVDRIGHTAYRWPAPKLNEILSFNEAVEGRSDLYMAPIRQASGPGYGYTSQGGKFPFLSRATPEDDRVPNAVLLDRIKVKISEAALGRGFNPYEEYQKSERLAPEKLLHPLIDIDELSRSIGRIAYQTANRLTNAGQICTQILMRALFAPWLDMMRRQLPEGPSMIGFNPWSFEWEFIEQTSTHIRYRVWSMDGRAWDISIPTGVLGYVSDEILLWFEVHCNDGLNWLRKDLLYSTFVRHFHIIGWFIFSRDGLASGNIITTEGNNCINEVVRLVVVDESLARDNVPLEQRKLILNDPDMFRCYYYGDDSKVFVHESLWDVLDQHRFASIAKELLGMEFISGDKGELPEWADRYTCKFLQRQTIVLDGVRFGAFPINECVEIARWVTDSGVPLQMARDNCEAALRELFFHGEAVFDEWHRKFSSALSRKSSPYLIRLTYREVYESIFGKPSVAKALRLSMLQGAHFDFESCDDESSSVVPVCSEVEKEEETKNLLERGVRLLKNKGYPVDVQHLLALVGETWTCNHERCEEKVQPARIIQPYPAITLAGDMDPESPLGVLVEQSQDLRETQNLPVKQRTETQTTADQTSDVTVTEPTPLPMSLYVAAGKLPDQGMAAALSRPYEVYSGQWLSTDASGTRHVLLNFPYDLFKVPQIEEKLAWFAYFRCKAVKLTIRLNLTSFHYGCLALSHVEGQANWGTWVHDGTFRQCLNNRPIFLSAMSSPSTDIVLPWTLPYQWFPVIMTGGSATYSAPPDYNAESLIGFMQRVQLHVVQPLSAIGTVVNPGTVTIFASFIDPEVQGPTLDTNPFPPAPPLLVVNEQSGIASDLEAITKAASNLIVGGEGKSSGGSHSVTPVDIARVAASFLDALDKPTLPQKDQPYMLENNMTMAYGSGAEHASKNTLHADAHLPDTQIYGNGNMSWKQLVQTPSCLDLVEIPGATYQAGDLVKAWYVHPTFNTFEEGAGSATSIPTFLQYGTAPFKWWHGSIRYQFRFFAPRFTTARLRLVWIPADKGLASVPPSTLGSYDVGNLYTQVIDVTGDTIANVTIPWLSPVLYRNVFPKHNMYTDEDNELIYLGGTSKMLSLGTSNGSIALYVVNDLTSPGTTVPVNITFAVFVAAGQDFEVGFYQGYTNFGLSEIAGVANEPEVPPIVVREQSGDVWKDFHGDFPPITPSVGFVEHGAAMPEKMGSLVDLLKRYEETSTPTMISNPLSEIDGGTESSLAYWMILFVWARGGFRIKTIRTGTGTELITAASSNGMYTPTVAGPGEPIRASTSSAVLTFEVYPYIPMPYWPLGIELLAPRDAAQSYFPFCATSSSTDPTVIYDPGVLSVDSEVTVASADYYRCVSDDFALYGLYSPPIWIKEEPAARARPPAATHAPARNGVRRRRV